MPQTLLVSGSKLNLPVDNACGGKTAVAKLRRPVIGRKRGLLCAINQEHSDSLYAWADSLAG
jgi:hypothetical protein